MVDPNLESEEPHPRGKNVEPLGSPNEPSKTTPGGPAAQNRGYLIIAGAILTAAVILAFALGGEDSRTTAAGGGGEEAATRHSVKGEFSMSGDYSSIDFGFDSGIPNPKVGQSCEGAGGYSDISAGVGVSVTDRAGDVLGTSILEMGTISDTAGDGFETQVTCTLPFTVEDLPDSDFFNVEVADRGSLGFTKAELEEADWTVQLGL